MTDKNSINVIWKKWSPETKQHGMGHGIEFHDMTRPREWSIGEFVAFVDGFGWYHGTSNDVVVLCVEPNDILPAREMDEMKQAIEAFLQKREIPNPVWMITPRIRASING